MCSQSVQNEWEIILIRVEGSMHRKAFYLPFSFKEIVKLPSSVILKKESANSRMLITVNAPFIAQLIYGYTFA